MVIYGSTPSLLTEAAEVPPTKFSLLAGSERAVRTSALQLYIMI